MSRFCILVGIVTVAGILVRLYGLGDRCMWGDEVFAWRMSSFPICELIGRVSNPLEGDNPPLYFAMHHYWRQIFGDSEFAMRLTAALPSAAAVPMAYLFTRELCRFAPTASPLARVSTARWVALVAAALMTTSELQVHLGRQVRMYGLGALLYLSASWALLRALRPARATRGMHWVVYGLCAIALCYTHNTAIFVVAAHLLFAAAYLVYEWRSTAPGPERVRVAGQSLRFVLTCLALGLVYLPEALVVAERSYEARESNSWMGPLGFRKAGYQVVAALCSEETAKDLISIEYGLAAALLVGGVVYALTLARGWAGVFLCLGMVVPVGSVVAYAIHSGISLFVARHLLFVQITWIVALALVLGTPSANWLGAVVRFAALIAWCFCCLPCWEAVWSREAAPGMRAAAASIIQQRGPGEPLLTNDVVTQFKLSYYFRGEAAPKMVTAIPSPRVQKQSAYIEEGELVPPYEPSLNRASKVWIVTSGPDRSSGSVPPFIPGRWRLVTLKQFQQDYPWEGSVVVRCFFHAGLIQTRDANGDP